MEAFVNLVSQNKSFQYIGRALKATTAWFGNTSHHEPVTFVRGSRRTPIRALSRSTTAVAGEKARLQVPLASQWYNAEVDVKFVNQSAPLASLAKLVKPSSRAHGKGNQRSLSIDRAFVEASVRTNVKYSNHVPCVVLGGLTIRLFSTLVGSPLVYKSTIPGNDAPLGMILERTAELASEHQDLQDEYNNLVVFIEMQKDTISELKQQVRRLQRGQGGMASLLLQN